MERRVGQKLMRKQMEKVGFSNRHDPGRDELKPGVALAPVLWCERDARSLKQRTGGSSLLPGVGAK